MNSEKSVKILIKSFWTYQKNPDWDLWEKNQ
mgnify:CR=1 FL=1